MTTQPTKEQLALAEQIADSGELRDTTEWNAMFNGALAAIIETKRLIVRQLDKCGEPCPQCWDAIENDAHLKDQTDAA